MIANAIFNDEQRSEIERTVTKVETKTACEIVPVVASSSGRYDRAEDIVGFWFSLSTAVTFWFVFPSTLPEVGSWSGPAYWSLLMLIAGMVAAFVAGVLLASKVNWLRKLFTPRKQMEDEVAERARTIFFDQRVHHTDQRVGLLIYISLYERMAVLLGDEIILKKLGQSELDRLCKHLTQSLREGNCAIAICRTINELGDLLKEPLPSSEHDRNELKNALVVLD
jgi:putative membrane protein